MSIADDDEPTLQIIDSTNSRELFNQFEKVAAKDIRVGYLVERTTDSNGRAAVQPHSTAGARPPHRLFAVRYPGMGMEAAGAQQYQHQFGPGDTYSAADDNIVRFISCNKGVVLNLPLADGVSAGYGDLLTSNGDGTVRALNTGGGETKADAVAEVTEDSVDSTGTQNQLTFVKTEVV